MGDELSNAPGLSSVSTDGTTITGNGTSGSPLAAVPGSSAFKIAATYAVAQALATGATPFFIFVAASSQFNNAPTMYFYDGINTGHVNQIASLLI